MSRDLQAVLRERHTPPNLYIMATRSDLLTRLKCAEARWGPTLVGAIIDHFHGPSLLMGRQALRPYRYRRIPVGGHEAASSDISRRNPRTLRQIHDFLGPRNVLEIMTLPQDPWIEPSYEAP